LVVKHNYRLVYFHEMDVYMLMKLALQHVKDNIKNIITALAQAYICLLTSYNAVHEGGADAVIACLPVVRA
jgi:hypothetical protein